MRKLKFLLLDDDRSVTAYIEKMIHATYQNAEIMVFDDGRAALNYIMTYDLELDVILIDLEMPEFDGLDVLRGVYKNKVDLNHKKIAILTGHEFQKYAKQLDFAEDIMFFQKPFTEHKLNTLLAS